MSSNVNDNICALLVRVSPLHRNADTQRNALHEYATQRGWSVYREYVDLGENGAKHYDFILKQLMADARNKKFNIVVVWKLDRFARSTKHLLDALEEFRQLGVEFVSLFDQIDTTTPLGKMTFTVVGAVADMERELSRERVVSGVNQARAQGKPLGRPRLLVNSDHLAVLVREKASLGEMARRLGISKASASRLSKSLREQVFSKSPAELVELSTPSVEQVVTPHQNGADPF